MAHEDRDEIAYRSIIGMILENRLGPGDFLLETELADLLQISRTPVRHALARLVAEGFLEKRRKKGCIIPKPTAEDAQQVFFARKAVESQTSAAAALYATEEEIRSFRNILVQQEKAFKSNDKEAYSTLNEQFHLGIAQAGRNIYLDRYCRQIFWRSNLYIFFFDRFYISRDNDPDHHLTIQQHQKILQAISDKDSQSASAAMIDHLENTYLKLIMPWKRE